MLPKEVDLESTALDHSATDALIRIRCNNFGYCPAIKSEKVAELSVLDKVSSKNTNIKIQVGKEFSFQNLSIKVLKCYNSRFDDDPEVTAYMQVKDITMNNNDKVFVFNDWTFASSPSIRPFDHPVYDVWLKKCYS